MKASKEFKYSLDGNTVTTFNIGDDVPAEALNYAKNYGLVEVESPQEKQTQQPANKAKRAPANKAK